VQSGGLNAATADRDRGVVGKIKVLVVEGDARVRLGVRSVVESFPDLQVVGEASSARVALELVENAPADVVIVDLALPTAAEGLKLVRELSQNGRSVLAMSFRSGLGPAALAAGAVCFVEKDEHGAASLVEAIRATASHITDPQNRKILPAVPEPGQSEDCT
jgi:DNA-binding NarL/FixJ family response regulator